MVSCRFDTACMSKRSSKHTLRNSTVPLFVVLVVICASLFFVATILSKFAGIGHAASDTVDEIHYSYGNTSDSIVFNWHGQEQSIYYGPDSNYGFVGIANSSTVTPVDSAGSFREVVLTGLQSGTTYHYKIGADGVDHTFQTIPTGDFIWVDMGDTTASNCHPWMTQIQSLIAQQNPSFVTHGGDITYANDCGVAAVHQFYLDLQAWSDSASFQPEWGNHEYGKPGTEDGMTAPAGTPQDSLLNYKGRSFITHAQTVPNDTTTKITSPGCGWETSSTTNTCQGEDWGWFQTGHVLFISYPEPWSGAYSAWQTAADQLMANAQADPNIDFIVTYGHRPAYSSDTTDLDTSLQTVLNTLAAKYSPTATNPNGKYILSVEHHAHWEEVFRPINGLVHITDGGGGAGQISPSTIDPNSIYHITHPAILSANFSASAHTLTVNLICGPAWALNPKATCTYGSVLYSQTFTSSNISSGPTATPTIAPTATPVPPTPTPTPSTGSIQWVTNQSVETDLTGWTGTYNSYSKITRVTNDGYDGTASVQVSNTNSVNTSVGVNSKPKVVSSTTAGVTYSGSVWVRGQTSGQTIYLLLREYRSDGTIAGKSTVSVKVPDTAWHKLSTAYTAIASGNQLNFTVWAYNLNPGAWFHADMMSLTSPQ